MKSFSCTVTPCYVKVNEQISASITIGLIV